ncbi:MAG: hypothetical protein ACREM8_09790 [Vulcanimicrobiaceae bacterium]
MPTFKSLQSRAAAMSVIMTIVGTTVGWVCVGAAGQRGVLLAALINIAVGYTLNILIFRTSPLKKGAL